jgi:hypothetical protein
MSNLSNIRYTDDFELLLKEEAEKAEAMSILHANCYAKFSKFSIFINIPVIIISSVIGFLSPLNLFTDQNIMLGGISIIVAILKTFDSYFDFTKRCETHRMTSLSYAKISKYIQLQLSLEKNCRFNAKDLYDIINNDLQNIRDAEPLIPKDIINEFNLKYKNETTARPAITNGLTCIKINKTYNENEIIIKRSNYELPLKMPILKRQDAEINIKPPILPTIKEDKNED